ncbi:MAG: segregation and condensation protein A [Candidatus Paceibacteria bacterium]|jgi:segregation and condensation protein A
MTGFEIKTEVFEGPMDLLLSLIEKRKLLINDISLSQVTDDYINYINDLDKVSLKKTSHFILTASTLLLIKSKSLLPSIELTEDEEQSIEDLETRLKIYKRLQEVSVHTSEMFGKNISFTGGGYKNTEPMFVPDDQISKTNLGTLVRVVINLFPKVEKLQEVAVQKVLSLNDVIENLSKRIRNGLQMTFREFSGSGKEMSKEERVNVIISFLAMLELVKQGIINVNQHSDYADIQMETTEVTTPNYS